MRASSLLAFRCYFELTSINKDFTSLHASFLTRTRESQKTHFKADISCTSLANNALWDDTQLALTWFGWPNGEKHALILRAISTKVSASHRKSTQVHASPGQTKSQVDPSLQLASPFGQGFTEVYYMATIVRALWLAAERALFSCNDRALWNFFSARRLFWVVSKTTCAWAKTTEKMDKVQLYFQ